MLGLCGTTVVTEYFDDNFVARIHRNGRAMSFRQVVSMALDVARGMQASVGMGVARIGLANFVWSMRE